MTKLEMAYVLKDILTLCEPEQRPFWNKLYHQYYDEGIEEVVDSFKKFIDNSREDLRLSIINTMSSDLWQISHLTESKIKRYNSDG